MANFDFISVLNKMSLRGGTTEQSHDLNSIDIRDCRAALAMTKGALAVTFNRK